jgi:hypothetical protein
MHSEEQQQMSEMTLADSPAKVDLQETLFVCNFLTDLKESVWIFQWL